MNEVLVAQLLSISLSFLIGTSSSSNLARLKCLVCNEYFWQLLDFEFIYLIMVGKESLPAFVRATFFVISLEPSPNIFVGLSIGFSFAERN